jgi:hypothetical protein
MKYFLGLAVFLFALEASAATVYFMAKISGLESASSPGPYIGMVIGKKSTTITPKETASTDECGNYHDGEGYSDSTTFNAELTGRWVVATGSQDDWNGMDEFFFTGTAPLPGRSGRITSISVYQEGTTDDGICTQNGITYYKYSATTE